MLPPPRHPVVIQKLKSAFSDWISIAPHVPKIARYGLGAKIESSFVSLLDITHQAVFAKTERKGTLIDHAVIRLDTLSFFYILRMRINWFHKRNISYSLKN